MRECTSAFVKQKNPNKTKPKNQTVWGRCLPLSWKDRQASISGGWTWLILHWETSKKSHGAGGRVVRSAVGGTLPFEMVLNQCQKEGVGGPLQRAALDQMLRWCKSTRVCWFTPAGGGKKKNICPPVLKRQVKAELCLLVISRDCTTPSSMGCAAEAEPRARPRVCSPSEGSPASLRASVGSLDSLWCSAAGAAAFLWWAASCAQARGLYRALGGRRSSAEANDAIAFVGYNVLFG